MPHAVVDLRLGRLVTANLRFAQLLKMNTSDVPGTDLLSFGSSGYRRVLGCVLTALSSGLVDSSGGSGTIRRPGGESIEVHAWMRALDPGQREGRALLTVVPSDEATSTEVPVLADPDSERLWLGSLDHDWNFREITAAAAEILAWDPEKMRGTSILAAVHPDDAPLLVVTLGHSTIVNSGVVKRLRVLDGDGRWRFFSLSVRPLCNHNPPRMAVAIWTSRAPQPEESAVERASRLEGHLWRIAIELRAAGMDRAPVMATPWWSHPAAKGLSRRQLEVLRRLVRLEPVRQIAQELFISESTVRNHLSAIYRAFDVGSRRELLTALQEGAPPAG